MMVEIIVKNSFVENAISGFCHLFGSMQFMNGMKFPSVIRSANRSSFVSLAGESGKSSSKSHQLIHPNFQSLLWEASK